MRSEDGKSTEEQINGLNCFSHVKLSLQQFHPQFKNLLHMPFGPFYSLHGVLRSYIKFHQLVPNFEHFSISLKLGMKQGLEGQTKA
jgi:hypothetical protein